MALDRGRRRRSGRQLALITGGRSGAAVAHRIGTLAGFDEVLAHHRRGVERPCDNGRKSQSCERCPRGREVGFHTLGERNEYVYICCGPATFRVVNMNPRASLAPVLKTTRA
jgi:hypothetical protein